MAARKSERLRVVRRERQQAVIVAGQVRVTRGNDAYESDRCVETPRLVAWADTTHMDLLHLRFSLSNLCWELIGRLFHLAVLGLSLLNFGAPATQEQG